MKDQCMIADTLTQSIPLASIRTDGGTQSRTELIPEKITEYAQLMLEGTVFPPIILFYDGSDYWLGDGFHRCHSAEQIDRKLIDAEIRQGTRRDAVLYSMEANTRHGIPLSLSDRKRCAKMLLEDEEWRQMSNREIGRRCGLSPSTVGSLRKEVLKESGVQIGHEAINEPVEPDDNNANVRKFRTNADKRQTVEDFFASNSDLEHLSNREIARRCGVDEGTVRNYRKELLAEQITQETATMQQTATDTGLPSPELDLNQEPGIEPAEEVTEDLQDEVFKPEPVDEVPPEPEEPAVQPEIATEPPVDEALRHATPEPAQELNQHPADLEDEFVESVSPDMDEESIGEAEQEQKPILEPLETTDTPSARAIAREEIIAKRQQKEQEREQRREENRQIIAQARTIDEALKTAKFSTIVIDPPWDWGDEGDADQFGRARPTYATMSIDELLALPVGQFADDDSHIYLWITNRSLPKGFDLLNAWGFRYVTCITWVKPSFGMGNYFRGQTEHLLFGVKGSQPLKRRNAPTYFQAQRGPNGHSSKPLASYDFIESCSPGPYLEIFARSERPGWMSWGGEL
jgi:N6-adenosine-specific RNA methylase IME4/DNA-binding CsgD family transcriptional regulator